MAKARAIPPKSKKQIRSKNNLTCVVGESRHIVNVQGADRYGRKPILMLDVCLFSVLELASAFAPTLTVLLVLRALFGFAMGGEWGIGASLVMESIRAKSRGWVSGFLQQGYAFGYLIAAVVYYSLFERIGWRGMFVVGVVPAMLVLYIRMHVKESPAWQAMRQSGKHVGILQALRGRWSLFFYVVVLMTAFNFLSHGTQDLYPTFLQVQHGFSPHVVGIFFVAWSERIGRRRAIIIAAPACQWLSIVAYGGRGASIEEGRARTESALPKRGYSMWFSGWLLNG